MPPSVTLSLLDHYVNHLHLFAYESIFYVCGSLPRTFTLFIPSDNRSPRFSILTGGRKVSISYTIYDSGYRLLFTLYTSFDWEELGSLWWEQELARRKARQGPGLQRGGCRHQWPSPPAGHLTSQSFSVPSTATPLIYYSHWVPSLHHPSFCLHNLRICLETLTRISQGW